MNDWFWIYGKDSCPYCDEAKKLLTQHNYKIAYIDVGLRPEFRDPEWKTVPQIFHGNLYIGGYTALSLYLETL